MITTPIATKEEIFSSAYLRRRAVEAIRADIALEGPEAAAFWMSWIESSNIPEVVALPLLDELAIKAL